MKSTFARAVSRLLIALMIWTPYQFAQAGMIGTDQVAQSAPADRATVLSFVSRADVAQQLQAFGLDPATAKQRIAAMSDDELRSLAGHIESQPAGGSDTATVVIVLIIVGLIVWWAWKR